MRPRGYMGRQLARAGHRRLDTADAPDVWNDDDILFVLSQEGGEMSGDLIVGEAACETWLEDRTRSEPLPERGLGEACCRLADASVAAGIPGSSAAGEFPKFTAMRDGAEQDAGSGTLRVIVKFSGKDDSATVKTLGGFARL